MKFTKIASLALATVMALSMAVPAFAENRDTALAGSDLATVNVSAGTDASGKTYNVTETQNGVANSVVVVNVTAATNFKVTVPIALHVAMDAEGNKTYADDMKDGTTGAAKIINECALGQVKISDVKVIAADGYTLSAWSSDFANMKVNSKNFGFKINGIEVASANTNIISSVAEDTIASTVKSAEDGKTDLNRVYADYTFNRSGSSAFPVINNGCVLPITYEAKLPAYSTVQSDINIGAVVFTVDFN